MIDADACIPSVAVAEIIPESVDRFLRIQMPDGVGPALLEQILVRSTGLGEEQCVVDPPFWFVGIEFSWNDVAVSGENDRLVVSDEFLCIGREPLKPFQLVVELGAGCRITVGEIQATDQHAVDLCLDVAAVQIVRVAWQTPAGFVRLAPAR